MVNKPHNKQEPINDPDTYMISAGILTYKLIIDTMIRDRLLVEQPGGRLLPKPNKRSCQLVTIGLTPYARNARIIL
jgi:hypothetical protein